MTCIVGLRHNGILYFGGDSISVSSYNKTINRDSKVFKKGSILFGTCGAPRMRNLLQHSFQIPVFSGEDPMSYLVNDFLDAMREHFKEKGFLQKKEEKDVIDGRILLGLQGELYQIGSELNINRSRDSYSVLGVGEEYAYGSLHTTEQMPIEPVQRLQMALEAAVCYNTDVAGPFTFVTSNDDSTLEEEQTGVFS
jgi:hypothetical protein